MCTYRYNFIFMILQDKLMFCFTLSKNLSGQKLSIQEEMYKIFCLSSSQAYGSERKFS